ncbi:MAG: PspC domain-containing protein [Bacteroidales bacterium]|nr:PspC domain-containing protein [Bacteroidales bacterium]
MAKRLFRSNTNRKIAGICGGLGEYFSIDPTIIRIGFIVALLFGGVGLFPYLIGMIIIPNEF